MSLELAVDAAPPALDHLVERALNVAGRLAG